jgi:hypothetical protein
MFSASLRTLVIVVIAEHETSRHGRVQKYAEEPAPANHTNS